MAITLATLRQRIRTTLENAAGFPDPLQIANSTESLTTLRDRVELQLQDASNVKWSTADLDEAITKALEEYNRFSPRLTLANHTVTTAGRQQSISLTNAIRIWKVEWPYNAASRAYPPHWVQFEVYPGPLLWIDNPDEPEVGDVIRIWYLAPATLNGLASATATTIPVDDVTYILNGACFYAGRQRAMELAESVVTDRETVDNLLQWANEHGKTFRYGIRQEAPAWQRYAYAYNQDDIDEGIRHALGRFNEIAPLEKVTTLTFAADSYEIDISSLSDLLRVTRAWCPYTAADPEHPPNWVRYETWGSTLFLDTSSWAAAGDVVRLWYEAAHTIAGLDAASTTTLPADVATLLVTGACAWVAEERIQESMGWNVPRKMKEWSVALKQDFDHGLQAYARRRATGAAGIARLPNLDRWENRDDASNW
jgi:hypothetical protein